MDGKRYGAAFALKGPGVGVKIVTPGKWIKQATQIQRLVELRLGYFFCNPSCKLTNIPLINSKD